MREAIVIVNRRARRLRNEGPLLDALRRAPYLETYDLAELDTAMREVKERRPRAVIFAGGDGSYSAGVTALVRTYGDTPLPAVALAPGGTVGTVARNFGMRGDRVAYVERLLAVDAERTHRRPTLRVNERVGFIFGAGLVARFFEVYDARGATGNLEAAKIAARVFLGSMTGGALAKRILTPAACRIEVDGERAPFDRLSLVAASTVKDLGLHVHLLYRAAEAEDRFHVVVTPLGPTRLGPQLPRVVAGRSLLGDRVDRLARRLVLEFPAGEGAWVLDGDLFRDDRIEVTPGPVLDVVTP